jgi:hypothetical protein
MERMRLLKSDKLHYDLRDWDGTDPARRAQPSSPEPEAAGPQRPEEPEAATAVSSQAPVSSPGSADSHAFREAVRHPMRLRQRLREAFLARGQMTTSEVQAMLCVSSSTATSYLKALCVDGFIEKVRPTASPRSHYYRVRSGKAADGT